MKIITFKAKIVNIFKSFADYFPIIFEDSDYGLLNMNVFNILFGKVKMNTKIKFMHKPNTLPKEIRNIRNIKNSIYK